MHIPRKRFGQHFLCDKAIIERIVAALAPHEQDHLIEIGPGQGAITIPVLKKIKQLEAVELDRDLIDELKKRSEPIGHLQVYTADALTFDFNTIKNDARMLRVFGNLPYNISTPLLFHLLTFTPIISDMLFMLQKEVAERLAATKGSSDYSRLSVMMQYHCDIDLLFDVSNKSFYPPPNVQSSIVKLTPYKKLPYQAIDYDLFAQVVKHAFGQRRKTLRNSLKEFLDDNAWAHIHVQSDLRPENLSVNDFVMIANAIKMK